MSVDYGPRDLCPLGHGPMWWWPAGGEWACQRPTCEVKTPVYAHETAPVLRIRETWLAGQRLAVMVTPPRSIFVTSIS